MIDGRMREDSSTIRWIDASMDQRINRLLDGRIDGWRIYRLADRR